MTEQPIFDTVEPPFTPRQDSVIPREPQPGDYMAEGDTGIEYVVNVDDGDWSPFSFPDDGDYQCAVYFDGLTCTDYGCKHSLEMQLNRFLALGLFTNEEIAKLTKHGFIVDGKFARLSARYNAIKSGTNGGQKSGPTGNYVYKPWDSARHDGMVPESLCPFPRLQRQPVFTIEQYFDEAVVNTPEVKAAAAVWLEIFETKYEQVATFPDMMEKHLKQAPFCIASKCCSPWDGSIIPSCGIGNGHCTCVYAPKPNEFWKDEDSYQPSHKRLAWDYGFNYALKGVLYLRRLLPQPVTPPHFTHQWTKAMNYGETSPEIVKLQDFLKLNGVFPASVNSTGYYGMTTAGAVLKFQIKYNVAPEVQLRAWGGKHVSSLTLPVLNQLAK